MRISSYSLGWANRRRAGFCLFLVLTLCSFITPTRANTPIIVDDWMVAHYVEEGRLPVPSPMTNGICVSGVPTSIVGGERDVLVVKSGGSSAGPKIASQGISTTVPTKHGLSLGADVFGYCVLSWDGIDGNPTNINYTGLSGLDLYNTVSWPRQDALIVDILSADWDMMGTLRVWSDATNWSEHTFPIIGTGSGGSFPQNNVLLYSDFVVGGGTGADFSNVGAVSLLIDPPTSAADVEISFLRTTATRSFIGDYVWMDMDQDGVQDAGEPGVSNVVVRLIDTTTGAVVSNALTDATGYYDFRDVAPTNYLVEFVCPSHNVFTTPNLGDDASDSDADQLTGRTTNFTALAGVAHDTWDAGLLPAAADISLIKLAGDAAEREIEYVTSGADVTYSYYVTNSGLNYLVVTSLVDDVLGTIYTGSVLLAPGAGTNLFVAASNITTDVTNTAVVIGDPSDSIGNDLPTLDDVADTNDAVVNVVHPGIQVIKTAGNAADGDIEFVTGGTDVVYTYLITNTGDTYLAAISLDDDVLGQIVADAGIDLAPGGSFTLYATNLSVTADVTNIATVVGNPTDDQGNDLPDIPSVTDNDDAIVGVVHPGIQVIKTAGNAADGDIEFVTSGTDVVYTYLITNTGDTYLASISLDDDVLGQIVANAGINLAPGGSFTLYATNLSVTADVINIATVLGNPTDDLGNDLPDIPNVTDDDDAIVDMVHPGIQVIKTAGKAPDGDIEFVTSGTDVVYTYLITNTGDTYLGSISLDDDVLGQIVADAGFDLAPGGSFTLYATNLSVTADVTNIATVVGNPIDDHGNDLPDIPNVTDDDDAIVDVVHPGIEVIKTAGNAPDDDIEFVTGGTDVVYTYLITNTGDTYLGSISLDDDVLGRIVADAGIDLAPGGSFTLYATNLNVTADVTNIATVVGNPTDDLGNDLPDIPNVTDDDDAIVDMVHPGIQVIKTAGNAPDDDIEFVTSGTDVVYTYLITNTGDTYLASISLDDDVLGQIVADAGIDLAPGGSFTLYATNLNVTADVTNIATVVGNPTDDRGNDLPDIPNLTDDDDAIVDVVHPGIEVIKTAGSTGDGVTEHVLIGSDVVYTYLITNTGDTYLASINLDDDVLGQIVADAGVNLPPGGSITFTATNLNITADVINIATVVANPTDDQGNDLPDIPNVTDEDDAVVEVETVGFTLDKVNITAPDRPLIVGEPVEFVITIVNTGSVDLVVVPVVDTYETNYLSFTSASPAPDDSVDDGTLNWANIGPLAGGAATNISVWFVGLQPTPSERTNTVVVSPQTGTNIPDPPPQITYEPYEIVWTEIGDTVWVDSDGNGFPNEDLTLNGLNGVGVGLYRYETGPVTGSWQFVTNAVTTTWTNGNRGFYIFEQLPYGQYRVDVTVADVPAAYPESTTLTSIQPPTLPYLGADFGFRPQGGTTPVELVSLSALDQGDRVRVSWQTATEMRNLGFNVYRTTRNGSWDVLTASAHRVNPHLIAGSLTCEGQAYFVDDQALPEGEVWYYWLEDVSTGQERTIHGPVSVGGTLGDVDQVSASLSIPKKQLSRGELVVATGTQLAELGVPVDQVSASKLKVWCNGEEIALFVSTFDEFLGANGSIAFYVHAETKATTELKIGVGPDALRMAGVYVEPLACDEATVWVGSATEGRIGFSPSGEWLRYRLKGLPTTWVWLLDVTDRRSPILLFGHFTVNVAGESTVELSYSPDTPASCVGISHERAVRLEQLRAATQEDGYPAP